MFKYKFTILLVSVILLSSCVSKKKFLEATTTLESTQSELFQANKELDDCVSKLKTETSTSSTLNSDNEVMKTKLDYTEKQVSDLMKQLDYLKTLRDQQLEQVGNLTVLSKSANDNINATIKQMEKKDKYIRLLQNAKSKADSINMVLAVSLKSELQQGIFDQDIQVSVDKTVVYIDLSDKMLFSSGSSKITPKAKEVLGKISTIIKGKTGFDVMVEGYTDSKSIKTACIDDNWDLSVKRATAVVRTLQNDYQVNGNRLIAAGRGEYKPVADNATSEGRTANRRTRIVILPQLDQFYELLNPVNIPK